MIIEESLELPTFHRTLGCNFAKFCQQNRESNPARLSDLRASLPILSRRIIDSQIIKSIFYNRTDTNEIGGFSWIIPPFRSESESLSAIVLRLPRPVPVMHEGAFL